MKQFDGRAKQYETDRDVDWATAEALAIGSLLLEGHRVRLAGEDSRRGTFSQRHAALIDFETGEPWIPLPSRSTARRRNFWVYDSLLSEYAALGYEYGYAHSNPDALVMWEAQFGDFVNGAQIIIDQYLVAAEDKWGQNNGLVLLLPHGYEGQGPEHSSARIERFLVLAAEDNIQLVNCTTAAQLLPPAAPAGAPGAPHAARGVHAEAGPADEADPLAHRPARHRARSRRCSTTRPPAAARSTRPRSSAWSSARARWRGTRSPSATSAAPRSPSCASSSSTRCRSSRCSRCSSATRTPASCAGSRRSPRTWARGTFVERRTWRVKERGYDIAVVARVESGSPATGSKTVHDQELADLMDETFAGY